MTDVYSPNEDGLCTELSRLLSEGKISIDDDFWTWESGVYGLVDCVFSSQARYESVVLPMLRERLPARPGMKDTPELKFSDFMRDVDQFEPDRWDGYGSAVLNLQKISGRRKVEVCYEVAHFLRDLGYETRDDLLAIGEEPLVKLCRGPLRDAIHGIGEALSRYLPLLFGVESQIKPDTMIIRFFDSLSNWSPRMGEVRDIGVIERIITRAAADINTTPARLDNAIWLYRTNKGA